MSINPTDPRAAYQQIADDFRAAISRGDYKSGARLPSHRQVAEQYGVAQMTVRQAFTQLQNEGLVETRHGRGTFVTAQLPLRRLGSDRYSRRWRQEGKTPFMIDTTRIGPPIFERIRFGPAPTESRIAKRLRIAEESLVLVQGLRFHSGGLIMQISTAYIPYDLVQGTDAFDLSRQPWERDTISNLEQVGINVDEVQEEITVRSPSPEEVIALQIRNTIPVFSVERSMYAQGQPVETCDIVMPTDRYMLSYRFLVSQ